MSLLIATRTFPRKLQCFLLLCAALVLQLAHAMPIPESSGNEEPPAQPSQLASGSAPTQQGHWYEFECNQTAEASLQPTEEAPSSSEEMLKKHGSLQTGMEVLKTYTKVLYWNWTSSDGGHCAPPVDHTYKGVRYINPLKITDEHMANWIGVFRAYADHVLSILELDLGQTYRDQMETLYAILSSVLMDYRDAMEPNFCGCDNCSVPEEESRMPEDCMNVISNVEYFLYGDISIAIGTETSWTSNQGIELSNSVIPSKEQWVLENIPNSANFPLNLFSGST